MQLLIIWSAMFICLCRENKASSCEVMAKVQRGATRRVSPGQSLTIKCPMIHCGELFSIIWYKISNTSKWEAIPDMENIKITQKHDKKNLISSLSFEQVSINDDGLYRCALHSNEIVSHAINISVSELNKRVENPVDDDDDEVGSEDVDDRSSLSIFLICATVVFLTAAAIVFILVCFHCWKRMRTCNNKDQEEISTRMIPELSKMSALSPSVQTQFSVLNDICSSSERPTSTSPALALTGNVADTAASNQASNCAVFTIINYQQCGAQARNYTCKQDDKANCFYQRLKS